VLFEDMDEIVARYRDRPYPYRAGTLPDRYPMVENTDAGLRRALGVT